jgi:16S rRNA (guanine(966)-N(2))-methyltransferase RsmD
MDRVKEALFNILGPAIRGSHFLDLFAGTGSVGIEALSRGAERAVFLDTDKRAIATIRANLDRTGLVMSAKVLRRDALTFLASDDGERFDYVYVAPPQYQGLWKETLLLLDSRPLHLNPDAWVVVQMDPTEREEIELERLENFDRRRYGSTELTFYEFSSR